MNILFLTLSRIVDLNVHGIYTDLIREFIRHGHVFYIVKPNERSTNTSTGLMEYAGVKILGVKTLNIQKTNVVEKGIGMLILEGQFSRAIRHYFRDVQFDLILYSTPPITFNGIIEREKKRCGAKSYLLLKDIFPQNAVDLGMFSKKSLIYKLFRKKEKTLYRISDHIGCMSPANMRYVLKHNPDVKNKKVEVCPNSIELENNEITIDRTKVRRELGVPLEKVVFIYGGNLGKPQGIDFLMKVLVANEERDNTYFLVIGGGTEYLRLKQWNITRKLENSQILPALPREQYEEIARACDVGMIFLDRRFTIPNYPSRLLAYLGIRIPVLMATDCNTDIGTIAEENGYGKWVESGDLKGFNRLVEELADNIGLRKEMGERGYRFLKENYTVQKGYKIIMKHFL